MAIQKIAEGISGAQAANLIYENDLYNEQLAKGVQNALLSSGLVAPLVIPQKYVNATINNGQIGAIVNNSLFSIKVFKTKGLSAVQLDGQNGRSSVYYIAQFRGDYNVVANFIHGQRLVATTLQSVSGWYSIHPDAEYVILTEENGIPLNITGVRVKGEQPNARLNFPFIGGELSAATKLAVLDMRIAAPDHETNYYQLSKISRANKIGATTVNTPNEIIIIRKNKETNALAGTFTFNSLDGEAENVINVAKLSETGVHEIALVTTELDIRMLVDCDAINEGSALLPSTDSSIRLADSQCELKALPPISDPTRVSDQWFDASGILAGNSSLYYKWYKITKGVLSRVKIEGQVYFSAPLYYGQFSGLPLDQPTFISGAKLTYGSQISEINEWQTVDPNAEYLIVGSSQSTANNYEINITDIELRNGQAPQQIAYTPSAYGYSGLGFNTPVLEGADYQHFIYYGQSLLQGNNPAPSVTNDEIPGNFMAGDRVVHGGEAITALNPLKSTLDGTVRGEVPVVTSAHHFAHMYRLHKDPSLKIIANSAARGSSSIETLSKECTNSAYLSGGMTQYELRFLGLIQKTKTLLDGMGATVACPFIVYMQGESNYSGTGQGLTDGTDQTRDKETYKALLLTLKNNMQDDIMAVYGQANRPKFFIYMTGRDWLNRRDQSITQAQIEFAKENDDVFLMNPDYAMAGMTPASNHLSANGARWYGELIGKNLTETYIFGRETSTIYLEKATVLSAKEIILEFKVPVAPLAIDFLTTDTRANAGFVIYNNNVKQAISNVSVVSGTALRILLNNNLLAGDLEIIYAGNETRGRGNVRDSDTYGAMFEYTNYNAVESSPEDYVMRDKDGEVMYGRPYPLYNWLPNIYQKLDISF